MPNLAAVKARAKVSVLVVTEAKVSVLVVTEGK